MKEAVRKFKRQNKEVFFPSSHPPGQAQVDFGYADVWLDGVLTKVALFVMTLPYSDLKLCLQVLFDLRAGFGFLAARLLLDAPASGCLVREADRVPQSRD